MTPHHLFARHSVTRTNKLKLVLLVWNLCTLFLNLNLVQITGGNCSLNKSFYCFQAGLEWNRLLCGLLIGRRGVGGGVRRAQQYSMDSGGQTGGCQLYRFCTSLYKWVHGCFLYMGIRCIGSMTRQVPHVQDFTWVYKVQTGLSVTD